MYVLCWWQAHNIPAVSCITNGIDRLYTLCHATNKHEVNPSALVTSMPYADGMHHLLILNLQGKMDARLPVTAGQRNTAGSSRVDRSLLYLVRACEALQIRSQTHEAACKLMNGLCSIGFVRSAHRMPSFLQRCPCGTASHPQLLEPYAGAWVLFKCQR